MMARILLVALLTGVLGCSGGNGSGDVGGGDADDGGNGDVGEEINGDEGGGVDAGGGDDGAGWDDGGADDGGGGDQGGVDRETDCTDGQDNDNDGRTDCEDTDCAHDPSACGLELVGGINVGGGDDWFCVYAGHQIWSSPNPGAVFAISHHSRWFKAYTVGDCYFMAELMEGFCSNPACTASQWCTPQDVCEDLPVPAPAGTISITGMGVPVTLNPDGNGLYSDVSLSGSEGFTSASVVTLTAAGGQTPAFSLTIDGVDGVAPPITCEPNLPPADQDYVVTWTPSSGESWVRLTLPTWHHAGMGSAIVCEVPDHEGRLVVPAAMINYYLAAGAVPERTYNIARFNRGIADLGNGYGVAFELHLSQYCDYFH
jgi:hypothetical protein